jgi:hypothetical protein
MNVKVVGGHGLQQLSTTSLIRAGILSVDSIIATVVEIDRLGFDVHTT